MPSGVLTSAVGVGAITSRACASVSVKLMSLATLVPAVSSLLGYRHVLVGRTPRFTNTTVT